MGYQEIVCKPIRIEKWGFKMLQREPSRTMKTDEGTCRWRQCKRSNGEIGRKEDRRGCLYNGASHYASDKVMCLVTTACPVFLLHPFLIVSLHNLTLCPTCELAPVSGQEQVLGQSCCRWCPLLTSLNRKVFIWQKYFERVNWAGYIF